ncbi:MAG: DedA family protein [Proteobacteria bacterium]|nr:DedA family protein [Pseudomonadota bacterium]
MSVFLDMLLHLDTYLLSFINSYGVWAYLALFLIIFCETGFVVTPFLPGDSLLFAAGSIAGLNTTSIKILPLFILLFLASILGNQVNYFIGRFLGPKVFSAKNSWFFNKKHLDEAHSFYQKHGGKTIILARFLPILRTFAPFVAGIGAMNISTFSFYNLISALLWVGSLLGAGYFLGSIPWVKDNFTLVIYVIVALSLLPGIFVFGYKRLAA